MIFPDAIILQIALQSDVQTLKALRLVSRYLHSLIGTYESSVSSQILHRLYSGSILEHFAFGQLRNYSLKALYEFDRRVALARWMAWVSVEELFKLPKDRPGEYYYPPATMPAQDAMEHITLGLGIIWRMSDMAKQAAIAELQIPFLPPGTYSRATRGHRNACKLEREVQKVQREYIQHLSEPSLLNLYYAIQFCARPLGDRPPTWKIREITPPPMPPPTTVPPLPPGLCFTTEHLGRRELVHWLIIREGPDFIAQAWQTSHGNVACTKLVDEEQAQRPKEQRDFEHGAVSVVYWSMRCPEAKKGDKYYGTSLGRPRPTADGKWMDLWVSTLSDLQWSYDPSNLTV